MFVTVIHRIHDPKGFQEAEAKTLEAGLPASVALPVHAATRDHRLGICIWEGESVAAVREVVEGVVGPYADNEYAEMEVDGLTPQLQNSSPVRVVDEVVRAPRTARYSISRGVTMAYAIIHHFPGGTKSNYEASLAAAA